MTLENPEPRLSDDIDATGAPHRQRIYDENFLEVEGTREDVEAQIKYLQAELSKENLEPSVRKLLEADLDNAMRQRDGINREFRIEHNLTNPAINEDGNEEAGFKQAA